MLRCSLASNPSHLQYWRTSKCPCHRACIYKACIWTKRGERCLLKTQCKQRSINYPSCESQWTSHQHLTTRLEETKTNSRKTNKVRGTCHDGSNTERIPISFRNDRRKPQEFSGPWAALNTRSVRSLERLLSAPLISITTSCMVGPHMSIQYAHYLYLSGFFNISSIRFLFTLVLAGFYLDRFVRLCTPDSSLSVYLLYLSL